MRNKRLSRKHQQDPGWAQPCPAHHRAATSLTQHSNPPRRISTQAPGSAPSLSPSSLHPPAQVPGDHVPQLSTEGSAWGSARSLVCHRTSAFTTQRRSLSPRSRHGPHQPPPRPHHPTSSSRCRRLPRRGWLLPTFSFLSLLYSLGPSRQLRTERDKASSKPQPVLPCGTKV